DRSQIGAQTHELSHTMDNFLDHAAYYNCTPVVFVPPTNFGSDEECQTEEYSDPFEVLGLNIADLGHLAACHKDKVGWFDSTQQLTRTTPGTNTYTLSPIEKVSPTGQPL